MATVRWNAEHNEMLWCVQNHHTMTAKWSAIPFCVHNARTLLVVNWWQTLMANTFLASARLSLLNVLIIIYCFAVNVTEVQAVAREAATHETPRKTTSYWVNKSERRFPCE